MSIIPPSALPHLVVVGITQGKRMQGLKAAVDSAQGQLTFEMIDYASLMHTPENILKSLRPNCWLKIDSPGESQEVQNHFIKQGWEQHQKHPLSLLNQHGELMATDDWFHGFARFLKRLEQCVPNDFPMRWLNSIDSILLMTDKWECQQHLQKHLIPIPLLLGQIQNYDELNALLKQHEHAQVFIKSRYGSSASGIIAYRRNSRGQHQAISTTIFKDTQAFNSKKVYTYTQEKDISALVNCIAQHDAYVEAWIPKPTLTKDYKPQSFDLRTIMIAGKTKHEIVRASRQPMTNLHLDSERIAVKHIESQCNLTQMRHILEQAASCIPNAKIIGFDSIATHNKTWVLEANAFGDLLLNVEHQGISTYETQIMHILQQETNLC